MALFMCYNFTFHVYFLFLSLTNLYNCRVHENFIIIGDLSKTYRRHIGDPSEIYRRPTCLIGDLDMLHRRLTCLIGDLDIFIGERYA